MDKINVGITITILDPKESLFTNGIRQNALILRDTFKEIDFVNEVYFIDFGQKKNLTGSVWEKYSEHIVNFEESLEKVNVVVTVCQFVSDDFVKKYRERGIRMVRHIMGNSYYLFNESSLFKDDEYSTIHKQDGYGAIWISPMLYETNKDLFECLHDAKAYIGPYVWSPEFIEEHAKQFEQEGKSVNYTSHVAKKKISVFEPNVSLVKTSVFPTIVMEKLHVRYPDIVEHSSMFGAKEIAKKKCFIRFAKDLHVNKAGKLSFEARYPIVWTLMNHTDIVFSHHQDNGLNYLYFDAAWFGYPVVHNSDYVKELGWHYSRYDADGAVEAILQASNYFNGDQQKANEYLENSRKFISQYLPKHPRNVEGYKILLEKLF